MANIKVSDELHTRIKQAAELNYRTIGGHIEFLLDYFDDTTHPDSEPVYMKAGGTAASTDVSDLIKSEATPRIDNLPDVMQLELPCCANEFQPCKHWVWDSSTGEGYKNSLSGRFMEVDG